MDIIFYKTDKVHFACWSMLNCCTPLAPAWSVITPSAKPGLTFTLFGGFFFTSA